MTTKFKVPERFKGTSWERDIWELDHRASMSWRYSALRILWRHWLLYQQEHGGKCHYSISGEYWEGEDQASDMYNEQVQMAADVLDWPRLWKEVTGIDVNEMIEQWDGQPGCYGFVLTYKVFEELEDTVKQMYPIETHRKCAYRPMAKPFPYPERNEDDPDPDAVLEWAVDMMKSSCVDSVFKARQKNVPMEDLIA